MNRWLSAAIVGSLILAPYSPAADTRQLGGAADTLPAPAASTSTGRIDLSAPAYTSNYSASYNGPRRFSGYYNYRPRMTYEREVEHGAYSTSNSRYGFPLGIALTGGFADVAAVGTGNGNPYLMQSPWYWNPMNANSQMTSPNPYPFQYPYAYMLPYGGYMPYGGYPGYGGYPQYGPMPYGAPGGNWAWNRSGGLAYPGMYPPAAGGAPAAVSPQAGSSYAPNYSAPFGGPQSFGGGNYFYW